MYIFFNAFSQTWYRCRRQFGWRVNQYQESGNAILNVRCWSRFITNRKLCSEFERSLVVQQVPGGEPQRRLPWRSPIQQWLMELNGSRGPVIIILLNSLRWRLLLTNQWTMNAAEWLTYCLEFIFDFVSKSMKKMTQNNGMSSILKSLSRMCIVVECGSRSGLSKSSNFHPKFRIHIPGVSAIHAEYNPYAISSSSSSSSIYFQRNNQMIAAYKFTKKSNVRWRLPEKQYVIKLAACTLLHQILYVQISWIIISIIPLFYGERISRNIQNSGFHRQVQTF